MTFKAFVINLERNPERLTFMKDQLMNAGIPFFREEAVDGKKYDFSSDFDEKKYKSHNNGNGISLGELGCALSHKHALERMLREGCDYALIMEDDISIPSYFKKIIDRELELRSKRRTSWDYLSFNYPSVGYKAIILWLFLFYTMFAGKKGYLKYLSLPLYVIKFFAVSCLSLMEGFREFTYRHVYEYGKASIFMRPLYLAGCYLVTQEGAKKILKTQGETILYTADRLPNVARVKENLAFYAYVPLCVIQQRDKFQSNSVNPVFEEKAKKFMGGRLLRE